MQVSVVIPTFNRYKQLRCLLTSIKLQTVKPREVIVVDASPDKFAAIELCKEFSELNIQHIESTPSVCIQRNIGIKKASGSWILLCDDDIELPSDYLEQLKSYLANHHTCGVVAGQLLQFEDGKWVDSYPVGGFYDLLWRFIFQLSIWGDISEVKVPVLLSPIGRTIKSFYKRRGNTLSLAGWPIITSCIGDTFQTTIYSLGANLVKREWLLNSPYDEVLDQSGIGDNFGVALGFPGATPIHVVRTTHAFHHRSKQNRLAEPLIYYRRILALHYFLARSGQRSFTGWLVWSLVGNLVMYCVKFEWKKVYATFKGLKLILLDKNPYQEGYVNQQKIVQADL